jgi:glycosyltransferase involved in cell wall biosynthesis
MMNELVSIIMPSYNTAKYISQSVESVLNQTYTNWELIIVDDCSIDNTDEIIKPYLEDGRIKYLKNEKNSGAAVSRNYALREAKGKWIAFLDSDGKKETYTVMFNPELVDKKEEYRTEESCLSLLGGPRKCVRYNKIKVKYQTKDMQIRFKTYTGWTAEIIQHEVDHCNGVLI